MAMGLIPNVVPVGVVLPMAMIQESATAVVSGATTWQRRWWLFHKRILPIGSTYLGLFLAPSCFSTSGVVVAVSLLLLTGLGVTVGMHRLLTHSSFSTYRWLERTLATLGALAFQGGVVDWATVHRIHHAHADTDRDPHTPKDSFWRGHVLWLFVYDPRVADATLKQRYVKDLLTDPFMTFLNDWSISLQVLLFWHATCTGLLRGSCLATAGVACS